MPLLLLVVTAPAESCICSPHSTFDTIRPRRGEKMFGISKRLIDDGGGGAMVRMNEGRQ
jgi:hypothetical protein